MPLNQWENIQESVITLVFGYFVRWDISGDDFGKNAGHGNE